MAMINFLLLIPLKSLLCLQTGMLAHPKQPWCLPQAAGGVSWVFLSWSLPQTISHLLKHTCPELLRVSKRPSLTQGRLQKHALAHVWVKSMANANICKLPVS